MGRFRVDSSIIEQQGGQDFADSDTELMTNSVGQENRNKRHEILSTFHDGMYIQILTDQRKSEKP